FWNTLWYWKTTLASIPASWSSRNRSMTVTNEGSPEDRPKRQFMTRRERREYERAQQQAQRASEVQQAANTGHRSGEDIPYLLPAMVPVGLRPRLNVQYIPVQTVILTIHVMTPIRTLT